MFIEITSRITSRFGSATRTATAEPSDVTAAPVTT
jgi:hypothetical protein